MTEFIYKVDLKNLDVSKITLYGQNRLKVAHCFLLMVSEDS